MMNTYNEIRSYIVAIIEKKINIVIDDTLSDQNPLGAEGFMLESIALVELIAQVERDFGITIPDEDLIKVFNYSMQDFVEYILNKVGHQNVELSNH